jgi:hypothetical protein
MFLGAAGGIALSHLPGLPLIDGVAMGIGAMSVVMLRLPLTSVLLATLLLGSDGLAVMPLVIVAVVVAYVASPRLAPTPASAAPTGNTAAHDGTPQPFNRSARGKLSPELGHKAHHPVKAPCTYERRCGLATMALAVPVGAAP